MNPLDDLKSIDAGNLSNVRDWAEKLQLSEIALLVLMEKHGRRIGDLRRAIEVAAEASEFQRAMR